jgi:hypothetical protein
MIRKSQRDRLLSLRVNRTLAGRRSLQKLPRANKLPAATSLLKEEFGQLWTYHREGWARRFFTRRREQLKRQRLRPFEQFAVLIERHRDGIAAYCHPRNKVKLGFIEGLNSTMQVIQRRTYGYRDVEYMRRKILTACLLRKEQKEPTRICVEPVSFHAMMTETHCECGNRVRPHEVRAMFACAGFGRIEFFKNMWSEVGYLQDSVPRLRQSEMSSFSDVDADLLKVISGRQVITK